MSRDRLRAGLGTAVVLLATAVRLGAAGQARDPVQDEARARDEDEGSYQYEYLEKVEIARALESVMSRPEFERLRAKPEEPDEDEETPGWLQAIADWLGSWLGSDEGEEDESDMAWLGNVAGLTLFVYAAAAILVVLALVWIVRATLPSSKSGKLEAPERPDVRVFRADRAPGELAPEEYWRRALVFGEAGDHRKAVREILLAAMSTIERHGWIRFRKGLTNRDYLYAVRGERRNAFQTIAHAFELIYFGRREATAETYRDCRQAFEESFGKGQPT